MLLNVSHIQHFSLGDGLGIRTTVFLKGCNLHCPWCHNPETLTEAPVTLTYPNAGMTVHAGQWMEVADVAGAVLADQDFYGNDGGATISGGEPLLQAQGVAQLCRTLRQAGIHTVIDTAACVPWASVEAVLPYADCFYVDWKTWDAANYRTVIGGDMALVTDNLRRLTALGADVHARVPVIPGFNDALADAEKIAEQLAACGVKHVDLLPFHRLGSGKYAAMGTDYAYRDTQPPSREQLQALADIYRPHFVTHIEQ